MPLGDVRLRAQGSAGGHNGLKDIQEKLATSAYARLRVGVGHNFQRGRQVDYVLSKFGSEETPALTSAVEKATGAIELFASIGLERAMNVVNTRSES